MLLIFCGMFMFRFVCGLLKKEHNKTKEEKKKKIPPVFFSSDFYVGNDTVFLRINSYFPNNSTKTKTKNPVERRTYIVR